ncbi:putative Chaperone protein DnaJ [Nannochloris sp. 'desiccata']|nr:putative Chaperone protein DnaJ [Chlorella desiccata (nom. nud.)]
MLVPRHAACFGKIENVSSARTRLPLTSTRKTVSRTHRSALTVKIHARLDPYKILGVTHDADEMEIKRAHRRLVLEHHPDRAHGKEGVEVKFLAIQEAYEILTGKRRGKEVDSGPASGWDFHDWFWRFKFSRRAGGGAATAQAPPPPEEQRKRLREQLSGLKAKAAAKRAAGRRRPAHADQATNPSEAAASSVWRSTTKNARTTQRKPADSTTVHTAFASQSSTKQVRLYAEAESATTTRVAVQEEMPHNAQPTMHTASSFASTSTSESPSASKPVNSTTSAEQEEEEQKAWRSLLTRAVHAVHDLHHRHNHSVTTHAQRIQSHISSIGNKLSQRLQLHALHELMPELSNHDSHIKFSQWKPTGFRFSTSATIGNALGRQNRGTRSADAGVPSENELHMLFSNSLHHHSHEKSAAATTAGGGNASRESKGEGYPQMDAHSRKFADKEHVKSRLTTQLTGLKRKNQLKREFDGWN